MSIVYFHVGPPRGLYFHMNKIKSIQFMKTTFGKNFMFKSIMSVFLSVWGGMRSCSHTGHVLYSKALDTIPGSLYRFIFTKLSRKGLVRWTETIPADRINNEGNGDLSLPNQINIRLKRQCEEKICCHFKTLQWKTSCSTVFTHIQ